MSLPSLLLVNDLSGVGKVAISATLPLLANCQVETHLLPTVLLSTHTAFPKAYRHHLNESMVAMLKHWEQLQLSFDAILTGYFGDAEQIDVFLKHLPPTKKLIVDPVMADNGQLYHGFSQDYPQKMKQLCQKASMIIPNLTEACLLVNQPYLTTYTKQDIQQLLYQLQAQLQVETIIITGISFDEQHIGAMFLHQNECDYRSTTRLPHHFFGTGDMFSALLTALMLQQIPLGKSIQWTLDFIVTCLQDTCTANRDIKYGVIFEKQLYHLQQLIGGNFL